jgi:CHAD domain-containing protein
VFLESMLTQAERGAALGRRAKHARAAARRALSIALASERYTRFVLLFARWLAEDERAPRQDLPTTAAAALDRKHARATEGLRQLDRLTPAERHRVRIWLKRLRYASESLSALYERERVEPYVAVLARLQDELGAEADAIAALRLLETLDADPRAHATARRRWRDRARRALAAAQSHSEAVHAAPRFWREAD